MKLTPDLDEQELRMRLLSALRQCRADDVDAMALISALRSAGVTLAPCKLPEVEDRGS